MVISNYFGVLGPEMTGYVVSEVHAHLANSSNANISKYGSIVKAIALWMQDIDFAKLILIASIIILVCALLRGFFMFMQRQTLIVMSRHIEYDMKNEIYEHYQKLDAGFFKAHRTGDLMNRIAEDVSRVRMYMGPAIMYFVNLVSLIAFCLINMFREDAYLSLLVLSPLPLLAITIYFVNTTIHKKSERVQAALSDLTTNAQESYSGIRVIKSFVQEKAMLLFFKERSEEYRKNAVSLSKVEAIFFPSMTLMVGLSTLLTIYVGGMVALKDPQKIGMIVEFVIYINMLTWPVTAIGSVASMIQRAAASQKRLNEFLETEPVIKTPEHVHADTSIGGDIVFDHVSFTYENTGIRAIDNFSLTIKEGEKILVLGKTGSGKSTIAQLLLRFYDPDKGKITVGGKDIKTLPLQHLRDSISYVPQDIFLFSDTVANNISFGLSKESTQEEIEKAASYAAIHNEILSLQNGYQTMVGERGVTLSGGQKQRVSIARALIKAPEIMIFDDCLSAVDAKTENQIINNLYSILGEKTAILITHRIFTVLHFDQIIVVEDGQITEQGTHEELIEQNGYYAELYQLQTSQESVA